MRKLFLLMTFVICGFGLGAQTTKIITGAVIDKNGNPLPNALVEATGGAESVTTDADGSFRIEVPIWLKSLTAKYAGLQDKKINVRNRDQVLFEMRPQTGSWFLDVAASADFGNGDECFGRIGLMGGYLGNWGGYARLMVPVGGVDTYMPSFTVGAIKHVYKPCYLYLGAGVAPVMGTYDSYYSTYDDNEVGAMFDIGAIFKIKKVNFSIGYSFSSSFCCYDNNSIQFSIGYCF